MTAVTAITWVFALLLAAAGATKIIAPAATGAALQVAKLPSDHGLVRVLGLYEVAVATAVLAIGGGAPAGVLALTYAAFAVFAARQARRGASCGCFGERDTPTTWVHVGTNTVGAATAAMAATGAAPAVYDLLAGPWMVAGGAVLLVTAAALLRLVLTALPDLTAAQALLAPEPEA